MSELEQRIISERLEKVAAIQRTVKSLAKNPEAIDFNLVIQRSLAWTEQQKSKLIESVLLGYPIPPVYTLRSPDAILQAIDGKQRLTTFIKYVNNEFPLVGLDPVYGLDINGHKFDKLPEEFQELIRDQNLTFYQFETLTTDQRNSLFFRLNNGKQLSPVELTRSILGNELLEFIDSLAKTPFIQNVNLSSKQRDKFVDQELILQLIGIITDRNKDLSGKAVRSFALKLRLDGLSEGEKDTIEGTFQYLSDAFKDIEQKDKNKVLKKNDVVAIVGAAIVAEECDPEEFANLIVPFIRSQPSGSNYSNTKNTGTAKPENVQKRIDILRGVIAVNQQQTA